MRKALSDWETFPRQLKARAFSQKGTALLLVALGWSRPRQGLPAEIQPRYNKQNGQPDGRPLFCSKSTEP